MANNLSSILLINGLYAFLISIVLSLFFINKKENLVRKISLFFTLAGCALLLASSSLSLFYEESFSIMIYRILPSLDISLYIDWISSFFILIISLVSLAVTIYSFGYVDHIDSTSKRNFLVFLMPLFIASMALVVFSKSMINLLIFWEIMSVSSFLLVMFDYENTETKKAGTFYFVMTQMSTVFLFLSFMIIYHYTGSFDIKQITGIPIFMLNILFLSLFFGFGIKAGIIPLHQWLPYAHAAGPSPISALMSGIMIKVGIYGIVRFLFLLPDKQLWWGVLILTIGTISGLLGVIYALKEHDLKRLLAYHSIENIGIILTGLGLFLIFSFFNIPKLAILSLAGGLFHVLNHALFKSLLFLASGSVINETGTKNIEEMGGLIKTMPITASLFLIGAISISALPPFNGFVSEFMIFQALFQSGAINNPVIEVILLIALSLFALTSALAAACFVKAFGTVFLAVPRTEKIRSSKEVSASMLIGPSILAFFCIILGIFSSQIFEFVGKQINYDFKLPNLFFLSIIIILLAIIIWIFTLFFTNKKTRISETWNCGLNSQNAKMEYTASGFSEPIVTIFSPIYRTKKRNERVFFDSKNALFKEGIADIDLMRIFEKYLYFPVAAIIEKISVVIAKFQNRLDLDIHLLYNFITILLLLIMAVFLL